MAHAQSRSAMNGFFIAAMNFDTHHTFSRAFAKFCGPT
jgi:hypothetical protein